METQIDRISQRLIRLSEVPDTFPIKKGKLYKWASAGEHPELFVKIKGMRFIDLDAFEKLVESLKQEIKE